MRNFIKKTPFDVATKAVGKIGKKVINGATDVGKKAIKIDTYLGNVEQRLESMFKGGKILYRSYGTLKKNEKTELTYSDVLVILQEPKGIMLYFVTKGSLVAKDSYAKEQWKIGEVKSLEMVKENNSLIINNRMKTTGKKFVFPTSLGRAEFIYNLIQLDETIEFEMTLEELVQYIENEKQRQKTDGKLHLVSKEDEIVIKKMLKEHGDVDINELQKILEKQIVVDEAALYKNYLNRERIGANVSTLFDEVQSALDDLEEFCIKLDVDVENIRPGVEMIQHNNNKLELVHTNQTRFMECMENFIDSLLIDPISLYTIRNCQIDLENALNLDKICKSATVVAMAANYEPPDEMKEMLALKEEQEFDRQVLKDFATMLCTILNNKLKVEMDFLNISKVSSLFGKGKTQKETLEGAHKGLQPYGGLIAWLRMYANEEFLSVRNQYVGKMSSIAKEYFSILVDQQKKNIQTISEKHEDMFERTEFDGPKIEGIQGIPSDTFDDENPKHPERRSMYEVIKDVIETIAVNAKAEFKFLLEVFDMEENGKSGINCLIDEVYKQSFDVLDKLLAYIDERDPFILLRIVHLCKTSDVVLDISVKDYSNLLNKNDNKEENKEESNKSNKDNKEKKDRQELSKLENNDGRLLRRDKTVDLTRGRKVIFEWLDHFYSVICSNAMNRFNAFIEKQINTITSTVINPKKHGVTIHFKRFPYFFMYLQIAAGGEEVWSTLNDLLKDTITRLLRESFNWLKNIKDSQIDQKPTITLRFQNFYYFQDLVSSRVITSLEPFIQEAKNEYMIALKNLCLYHCNLHFGKFYDFFDHVARLIPSMKRPEEIAYQSNYSRQMAAKTCKLIVTAQLTKSIDYMCKSIKHHIIMQNHREKAWETLRDYLTQRYIEAEKNCELVYKHKFDVPSENLDKIFTNAFQKTYKTNDVGEIIDDPNSVSETFEN